MFNDITTMVNEVAKELNTSNIIQVLIALSSLVVIVAIIYTKLKEAIVKASRAIGIVIVIICIIGIQQKVLGDWLTKLTTYIK
jgi:steroid 5-alpha reductase family enzyme